MMMILMRSLQSRALVRVEAAVCTCAEGSPLAVRGWGEEVPRMQRSKGWGCVPRRQCTCGGVVPLSVADRGLLAMQCGARVHSCPCTVRRTPQSATQWWGWRRRGTKQLSKLTSNSENRNLQCSMSATQHQDQNTQLQEGTENKECHLKVTILFND